MKPRTFIRLSISMVFGLIFSIHANAQSIIEGTVTDAANAEKLIGVSVSVIGNSESVITNVDGRFLISLNLDEPKSLELYLKGYQRQTVTIVDAVPVMVSLERIYSQGFRNLTESTYRETELLNADFAIDQVNSMELLEMPNGPGLDGLSNYHSIFSVSPGDRMQTWDFRGFNATEFSRAKHLTDGVDQAIPDFGSPIGMLTTPADIDISGLEIRTGPASTLFGNGAYSGMMGYSTKSPWQQRGLSVSLRGGTGSEIDAQARFAQLLDKNQRWGLKIVGQFNRLDAVVGNHNTLNHYGAADSTFVLNPEYLAEQLSLDPAENDLVLRYFHWATNVEDDALITQRNISHDGYSEDQVAERETRLLKLNGSLHFKMDDKVRISYDYRMGYGTGFYQADSRFSLHNFLWQQHALRAEGTNWNVQAYGTFSHSGNSYNINGVASSINQTGAENYLRNYLLGYADSLDVLSSGFQTTLTDSLIDQAREFGLTQGGMGWYIPATNAFDSIVEMAQNSTSGDQLSSMRLRSATQGVQGRYLFDLKWMDILIGMNFKRDDPNSDGLFYSDSTGQLSFIEAGGSAVISTSFFKEKLSLKAGVGVNKNELFKTQINPSGSIRLRLKNNVIWASFNTGYRNPNYWDLYRSTFDGSLYHIGNSTGISNVVEHTSGIATRRLLNDAINGNGWPSDCPPGDMDCLHNWVSDSIRFTSYNALQPERTNSLEAGFRSILFKNLFLDVSGFYSWHHNRIYYQQAFPFSEDRSEFASSFDPDSIQPKEIEFATNSSDPLRTMGAAVNVTYHFSDRIWANANYTYSKLLTADHESLETVGFNVPDHRMNVGLRLRKIWKGLGFSSNFRLHDGYTWQSRIGSLEVPWTMILDAQISYHIPKLYSTLRVGGSNIINTPYKSVAAGSPLASTFYASILFDLSVQ